VLEGDRRHSGIEMMQTDLARVIDRPEAGRRAVGDRPDREQQLGWLVEEYRRFHEFDPRELHLVEALRTLRMINYQAWLARRWDDPAFPAAFPWFGEDRHWETVIGQLREQMAELSEPPLSLAHA